MLGVLPEHVDAGPVGAHALRRSDQVAILDAVVIRRQDLFAGPALNAYSHAIGVALSVMKNVLRSHGIEAPGAIVDELQNSADYFHEQAEVAHEEGYKLPD